MTDTVKIKEVDMRPVHVEATSDYLNEKPRPLDAFLQQTQAKQIEEAARHQRLRNDYWECIEVLKDLYASEDFHACVASDMQKRVFDIVMKGGGF